MRKRNLLISLSALATLAFFVVVYSSCKGPKGDVGPNGKDGLNGLAGIDANSFCRNCHTTANWSAKENELNASKHVSGMSWGYAGNHRDCARCHSSQGYLETLNTGLDTTVDNHMVGTTSYTSWIAEPLSCHLCHTFHGTLQESDFPNYALRKVPAFQSMFNPAITLDLGESNLCIRCHQNRPNDATKIGGIVIDLNTTADTTMVQITSQRYGGHHGPQAQLRSGVGKGEYEITGPASYTNSTGMSDLDCFDCHIINSTASDADSTGSHYFKLKNLTTGNENVSGCVSCHTGATNHDINGVQTTVKGLLLQIETKLIAQGMMLGGGSNGYGGVNSTGYIIGDNGTTNASSSNPRTVTAKKAKAIFDFKCVMEDHSYGVHNANYIKALLTNANAAL